MTRLPFPYYPLITLSMNLVVARTTSRDAVARRRGSMWRGWTYAHQWHRYLCLVSLLASTTPFVIAALVAPEPRL